MDLKEFWDKFEKPINNSVDIKAQVLSKELLNIFKKTLGMFFWERGGKQFVFDCALDFAAQKEEDTTDEEDFKETIEWAKDSVELKDHHSLEARNFLDCLACLGEDKVKELIQELR